MRKTLPNPNKCAITYAMGIIGNKWKPIIVYALNNRTLRFGQMATQISGISRKVLTEQLRELEEDHIILRNAYAEIPPRVEYSLTDRGVKLLAVLDKLAVWACETNTDCAEKLMVR